MLAQPDAFNSGLYSLAMLAQPDAFNSGLYSLAMLAQPDRRTGPSLIPRGAFLAHLGAATETAVAALIPANIRALLIRRWYSLAALSPWRCAFWASFNTAQGSCRLCFLPPISAGSRDFASLRAG